jgi:site-specific DNA recombinase
LVIEQIKNRVLNDEWLEAEQVRVYYNLPVPVSRNETKTTEVLPIITPNGAEGTRTPDFLLAKEALSRLSYSPTHQKAL